MKIRKKVDFRKCLDPLWDFVIEIILKIVISTFNDNLVVQKIMKDKNWLRLLRQSAETNLFYQKMTFI